ncbi:MAG: hypothetical protein PHV82_18040 [Victivallaceae bacterium]|nr:hypothetical protein [Victivallaceae bacterium]
MAEKLQGLLEKIKTEGLEKAEAERQKILDSARKEAQEIIAKASREAESTLKKAEENAENLKKRAETAVKQASRDIMLKLKGEIQKRLENLVRNAGAASMTPEFMGEIIREIAKAFNKNDSASDSTLELLVSGKDREKLLELLRGSLAAAFKETPEVFSDSEIGSGLKIGFKGNDIFFDFTDDAVTELVCAYVGPKLAALLEPAGE